MSGPVLIVGAGPTGLTAALELSRMGVPVILVDQAAGPATTSRAIGVQARTLELLQQRGLADEMISLGNKGYFGSIYGGGKRVFHLDFGKVDSVYPYLFFISQAETERILRTAVARQGVEVQWNTKVVGFAQSSETATATAFLQTDGGAVEAKSVSWLIDCGGAHSLVRNTLDIPFEGHTRVEQYALGDLLISGDLADTDFHIFSSEHGFMGLFPMGGGHFRLIASNPFSKPSKDTAPSLAELQQIYDQRSHIPARFHDLTWSSWFRINSRMVSKLKVGRLFLGGDSSHIHSPAGAQGMNTGIQDMINLCWKLAMVIHGEASPSLLDTYEQDRLPVIRGVLSRTDTLTTMIGTENPVVRTLFNHIGPFIGGADKMQEEATAGMSQIALNYRESALSENHGHSGSLHAGDRVPNLKVKALQDSVWSDVDLFTILDPSRMTLLVTGSGDEVTSIEPTSSLPGLVTFEIAPIENDAEFEAVFGRGDICVLVRPDGYAAVVSALTSAQGRLDRYARAWFNTPAKHKEASDAHAR